MSAGSSRLEDLIAGARERSVDDVWDLDRADRVRSGAVRRRDVRTRRDRVLRRGLLVAGGAGLLVLALLRGASSAPAERDLASTIPGAPTSTSLAAPASPPAPAPTAEALAARSLTDAGYARD